MRALLAILVLITISPNVLAISVIRDAEIETTLKRWTAPVIKSAGMSPNSVNIIIIRSPDVNAFVAGGAHVFIYTGLLLDARNPNEIIGVFAHELGHIKGGHLIASKIAAQHAGYESMLASIIGIGAAFATGDGGAAVAISGAGQHIATRDYLTHSRGQESSADQAAVTFLDRAGINPSGLGTFLEFLGTLSASPYGESAAYTRTHPLTRDRISALEKRIQKSKYSTKPPNSAKMQEFARMRAKLIGFLYPSRAIGYYPPSDKSIPAIYARTIADFQLSKIKSALIGADKLLSMEGANPYFLELKGQILFESSRAKDALPYYKKALEISPNSDLIRIAYGHVLVETGNFKLAIVQLKRALRGEPRSSLAHRLLATAYGRTGDNGRAELHLAEEALLQGKKDAAMYHAKKAKKDIPKGSASEVQVDDILSLLESNN